MPSILAKSRLTLFPPVMSFVVLIFLVSLYSKQYGPDQQQFDQESYCLLPSDMQQRKKQTPF